jgi:hypothetical protein
MIVEAVDHEKGLRQDESEEEEFVFSSCIAVPNSGCCEDQLLQEVTGRRTTSALDGSTPNAGQQTRSNRTQNKTIPTYQLFILAGESSGGGGETLDPRFVCLSCSLVWWQFGSGLHNVRRNGLCVVCVVLWCCCTSVVG